MRARPRFRILTPRLVLQLFCIIWAAVPLLQHGLPPISYGKDLQADWLAARGILDGDGPLARLDVLAARYFPPEYVMFQQPSPHPPIVSVLFLPLALIPYPVAALLVLALSLAAVYWVGRRLGFSRLGSLALAAWPPLLYVLDTGGLEIALLLLVVLAYRDAGEKRDLRAGILLGLAAALKLYPALLVLPYLFRGRGRLVAGAALAFGASWLVAFPFLGLSGVLGYVEGLRANVLLYQPNPTNTAPLILLGPWTLALGILALYLSARRDPRIAALVPLFTSPLVWTTYLVLALPLLVERLRASRLYWLPVACASLSLGYLETRTRLGDSVPDAFALVAPLGYILLVGLELQPTITQKLRPAAAGAEYSTVSTGR